jgi:hypothetical protein
MPRTRAHHGTLWRAASLLPAPVASDLTHAPRRALVSLGPYYREMGVKGRGEKADRNESGSRLDNLRGGADGDVSRNEVLKAYKQAEVYRQENQRLKNQLDQVPAWPCQRAIAGAQKREVARLRAAAAGLPGWGLD